MQSKGAAKWTDALEAQLDRAKQATFPPQVRHFLRAYYGEPALLLPVDEGGSSYDGSWGRTYNAETHTADTHNSAFSASSASASNISAISRGRNLGGKLQARKLHTTFRPEGDGHHGGAGGSSGGSSANGSSHGGLLGGAGLLSRGDRPSGQLRGAGVSNSQAGLLGTNRAFKRPRQVLPAERE